MRNVPLSTVLAVAAFALLGAAPAHAYIGPGVGLGVLGTVFGIVATLALAVFGFLWYPAKRLLAKRRAAGAAGAADDADTVPGLAHTAEPPAEPARPAAEVRPVRTEARGTEREGA